MLGPLSPGVVFVLDSLFSHPETSLISPSNSDAVSEHILYVPVFSSMRNGWDAGGDEMQAY